MLFAATHVGTKKLIEDYIEEVSQSLAYIASSECITFQRKEKSNFLKTVKSIWTACSYVLRRSNLRSFSYRCM